MGRRLREAAARLDEWRLLPAIFFTVAPALVVRLRLVPVAPDAAALWETPLVGDTRSWWKAACVVGAAGWMLMHILARLTAGRRPRTLARTTLLAAAALGVLVSALLSLFPRTAWLGYTAFYEGGLILLSYLVAMWYGAEVTTGDGERVWVLRAMGMVALVNGVIAVLEGFGDGFWQSGFGHWLMGAGKGGIEFRFTNTGMVSGTVYQPNHYGMFMAMLAMLACGMARREEGKGWRTFWLAAFFLGIIGVVCSFSRAAMIAAAVVLLGSAVTWLVGRRRETGNAGGVFPAGALRPALIGAGLLAAFLATGGTGRIAAVIDSVANRNRDWAERHYTVKDVELRDNLITVTLENGALELKKTSADAWATRRSGDSGEWTRLVPGGERNGWASLPVPEDGVGLRYDKTAGAAELSVPGAMVRFQTKGTEILALDYKNRLHAALTPAPALDSGWFSPLFSGRGYIWSRTLPLAARSPWFGTGPGTYPLAFPELDLVGKQRYFFSDDVDKGHGVWSTFLVQLGVIGFIAYCLPVAYAVRAGWRRGGRFAMPALMAVSAYLIGAITNDSTVGVTPIFCMLVGMLAGFRDDGPAEPDASPPDKTGRRRKKGRKARGRPATK